MLSRRHFVQGSLCVSIAFKASIVRAFTESLNSGFLHNLDVNEAVPLHKLVVDKHFVEDEVLVAEIKGMGVELEQIQVDPSRLWYEDLQPFWRKASQSNIPQLAVAGITTPGVAHCLELLSRREGVRLIYRKDYYCTENDVVRHVSNVKSFDAAGTQWALDAVQQMTNCSRSAGFLSDTDIITNDAFFVSWVMMPTKMVRQLNKRV